VAVGNNANGLLVTGEDLNVDDNTGERVSGGQDPSDAMNTSQGGDGATIGVNSQMFKPGSTGVFTLVTGFAPLDADGPDATGDNVNQIDYNGYLNTGGASLFVSQTQGQGAVNLTIDVFEAGGGTTPEEGFAYIGVEGGNNGTSGAFADDTLVGVDTVTVKNAGGVVIGTWVDGQASDGTTQNGVKITITGNSIDVEGIVAGYTVNWTADSGETFNRFHVTADTGSVSFDVGRIDIAQGVLVTENVGEEVFVHDDGPTVSANATALLDDDALTGGNAGGTGDDVDSANTSGTLGHSFGTDGGSIAFLTTGAPTGFTYVLSGSNLLIKQGDSTGPTVVTVTLNTATGDYTVMQNAPIMHAAGLDENNQAFTLNYRVTDGDTDTADGTLAINVDDDTPTASQAQQTGTVDEDGVPGGIAGGVGDVAGEATVATGSVAPLFNSGADQPLTFSLNTDTSGLPSLTSAGVAVTYAVVGNTLTASAGGNTVFTFALNGTSGAWTFTLVDQLDHPTLNGLPGDDTENDLAINLSSILRATDFDSDTVAAAANALIVTVDDDTPTIGPIPDALVDFAAGSTTGPKSLLGAPGADDNSTYTITAFEPPFVVNGVTVNGVLSADAGTVNYFGDDDGTPGVSPGDTLYYTLALDQTDPGAYTFTVHVAPPPAELEFNFDELPSGANLFGVVGESAAAPAIIVIGENIDLLPANNKGEIKYSNDSDTIHTSQGGTGATIGVNNQLFDNLSEGAYFTYVNNPVQDFLSGVPGGLTSTEADLANNIQYTGGTLEVSSAFFAVSQMQGNDRADVKITAFDIDDAPQAVGFVDSLGTGTAVPIDTIRVFSPDDPDTPLIETSVDATANGLIVDFADDGTVRVFGLDSNFKVEWDTDGLHDRVLIESASVASQFDIGRFGISQPQPTPDQVLDFTVQIADGDGDTASDSFAIGIDGTGMFDDNHVDGVNA
jgi:T1SS-143 domain-containing protein